MTREQPWNGLAAMTWSKSLRCVFDIDVEMCHACGDAVKVIVCIKDPVVIRKMTKLPG
jgi:hypothetical protein